MKKRIVKGEECLNCGQSLDGENFCPTCGQLNNIAKPTFGQLISDALANLFAWDSKFYLSIWPLLSKPGKLSLDIVNGKKNSYLPPIRLFVLMVIISFLLQSITKRMDRSWDDIEHLRKSDQTFDINDNTEDSTAIEEGDTAWNLSFDEGDAGTKAELMFRYAKKHPGKPVDEALTELGYEVKFWNHFIYACLLKISVMSPKEYFNFIKSNLMLILLMFVPFLALILKVLYFYKREYFYVDHFVFSVHVQTILFVIINISIILDWFTSEYLPLLTIFIGFPVYLFLSMKNFYKQRKTYTFINFIIVNVLFLVVGSFFLFLVLLVSFFLV